LETCNFWFKTLNVFRKKYVVEWAASCFVFFFFVGLQLFCRDRTGMHGHMKEWISFLFLIVSRAVCALNLKELLILMSYVACVSLDWQIGPPCRSKFNIQTKLINCHVNYLLFLTVEKKSSSVPTIAVYGFMISVFGMEVCVCVCVCVWWKGS
jgi:hypothetical protein